LAVREAKHAEAVILNQGEDTAFGEDLAEGALAIVAVETPGNPRLPKAENQGGRPWPEGRIGESGHWACI
jgi:hypothetical protein